MIQKYYHYTKWEDFQSGMYEEVKEGRTERVKQAACLLSNPAELHKYMSDVVNKWKYATEQNLTNPNINYQAFLGQSACCLYAGIKEDETREAWGTLTELQRYKANAAADSVYKEWRHNYERQTGGYQMSFDDMEAN